MTFFFCHCADNAKDVDSEMTDASEDCLETSMTYSEEAEPDDNLSENLGSAAGKTQQHEQFTVGILHSFRPLEDANVICHKGRH